MRPASRSQVDEDVAEPVEAPGRAGRDHPDHDVAADDRQVALAQRGELEALHDVGDVRAAKRLPDLLVREVLDAWAGRAAEKGLTLSASVEPALFVRADRRLLRQALDNLVENAVKYVPAGREVRIESRATPEGAEIAVADTGEGIPREDQPRVFERFYRVEKGRARSRGGTGLGLAIVKHVAEVHGGRAELESTPGGGARFRIVLPA